MVNASPATGVFSSVRKVLPPLRLPLHFGRENMFQSLIHKTLDGLKKRLVNHKMTIQGENGRVEEVSFSFNEPAADREIQDFIRHTGFRLPDDYQAFLRLHNGANRGSAAKWNCAVCRRLRRKWASWVFFQSPGIPSGVKTVIF